MTSGWVSVDGDGSDVGGDDGAGTVADDVADGVADADGDSGDVDDDGAASRSTGASPGLQAARKTASSRAIAAAATRGRQPWLMARR